MAEKQESTPSYFQDPILFGLKGEFNEVKWLKYYIETNPSAKIYITEREAIQDKQIGEKRKVEVAKYLEVRDQDGDDYDIIAQIKLTDGEIASNYPVLIASKELVAGTEGEVAFKSVGQLKGMKNLERGYFQAVHKQTDTKGYYIPVEGETIELGQTTTVSLIDLLPPGQPIPQDPKTIKNANAKELFVTESSREGIKKELERFIKSQEEGTVTLQKINEYYQIRPKEEFTQMLSELCYTTQVASKNVYKLRK